MNEGNIPQSVAKDGGIVAELRSSPWKLGIVAVLIAFPFVVTSAFIDAGFWLLFAIEVFVFGIAVLSYDLMFGYTGLLTFGHALFFGGGAYGIAIMAHVYDLTYLEAFPVVLVLLFVLGLVVGVAALQLSGVYFAIITLAFAQLAHELILQFNGITGGVNGIYSITIPDVAGFSLTEPIVTYYVTLAACFAVYLALRRVTASPFGRVIQGIRENEERIEMLGINTFRYKLSSFVLAGVIGGFAGMLYPLFITFVSPPLANWTTTGDLLMMTLIGGFGTLWGPLLGTGFYVLLETVLSGVIEQWRLLMGVIFVLFVLFLPSGIAGLLQGELSTAAAQLRTMIPGGSDDASLDMERNLNPEEEEHE
ncbi:branched-chain amino acid ABC transporter permease [Natrinema caseinilyticum]|uniref:branched-chain amino acid ABC transporter permease n=1 Tax=Natrinema caseinilyticum TaxID=2961570 RepID=UPI0020C4550C|nr:branched-chain amino acid ABC transporter permease [Natrinema caseinilyticum]